MRLLWVLFALSTLAACSSTRTPPGAVFDEVQREMDAAVAARPKAASEASNRALAEAMMPPLQVDPLKSEAAPEPRFDLVVSQAPAAQVFMAIVSGTRYNMLVGPEVSGNLTVNLKNVTVREALETLRELYGYEFKIQGTRIHIQPNVAQTRLFKVNYLAARRVGGSDVRVTSSSISSATGQTGTSGTQSYGNTSGIAGTTGIAGVQAAGSGVQQQGSVPGAITRSNDSTRVVTISDNDFWGELKKALQTIISGDESKIIINPLSGVILVRALPSELRAIEEYLRATQLIIERQVMLEAKIIEVSLSDSSSYGVNWAAFSRDGKHLFGVSNSGTTLSPSGSTLGISGGGATLSTGAAGGLVTSATQAATGFYGLAFQSASFAALLNFLESQGNVQVLSSPRIATLNNQKAVLKVGTDEFYVTNVTSNVTSTGTTGGTVISPTINLQPFFSGIALDVTPQIDDEGNITLHVHPSVSEVSEKQKQIYLGDQGTYTLPLASSKVNESDAIVRVQDGNIVAIGGLMAQTQSQDRNGLAGVSSLPGVGPLFGQRTNAYKKSELVILLKPTLIQMEGAAQDDLADTRRRIERLDPRLARP